MASTYVLTVVVGLARTSKQLSPQQVSIVLQKSQVEIPEELHVFVLHTQLLRRIPVDDLKKSRKYIPYRLILIIIDQETLYIPVKHLPKRFLSAGKRLFLVSKPG